MAVFRLYEDFKNLDRTIAFLQEKGLIHKEKLCRNGHSMKLRKRDDRYRWRRHNASCLLEVGLREGTGNQINKAIVFEGALEIVDLFGPLNGLAPKVCGTHVTGGGLYINYLTFVCGLATLAGISSMQAMVYILPTVTCELDLSSGEAALVGTVTFIGSIISSNFIGFLVDQYGRRQILVITTFGVSLSTFLESLSPNAITLIILLFCSGLLLGGVFGLPYVYLSEFCCKGIKEKHLTLASLLAILANIYSPCVAWAIIWSDIHLPIFENYNFTSWRLYLILNVLPMFMSALMFAKLPESPKFLLFKGRDSEAHSILAKFYAVNRNSPLETFPVKRLCLDPEDEVQQLNKKDQGGLLNFFIKLLKQIRELFRPPLALYTIICSILMFAVIGVYATILLWLPPETTRLLKYAKTHDYVDVTLCEVMSRSNATQSIGHCHVENEIFLVTTSVGAAFFSLTLLMVFLVQKFDVKYILGVNILLASAACFSAVFSKSAIVTLVSLGAVVSLLGASQSLVYSIIVNYFPTSLRATASSVTLFFGRGTAPLGSSIVGALLKSMCNLSYLVMAASLAAVSITTFFIPLKKKNL